MSDEINYRVTLYHEELDEEATVIVAEVVYKHTDGFWVRLKGTDPDCYPEWAQESTETRKWFSKGLTLMLGVDDPVDVIAIGTTEESIPEPEPVF